MTARLIQQQGYTVVGIYFYTIGQKRDLQIDSGGELGVVKIDAEKNTLVVDTWESLYTKSFIIDKTHFADLAEIHGNNTFQVMIRGFGLNPDEHCRLEKIKKDCYEVHLEKPAWAVAPSQSAVFYAGDLLVGGGLVVKN